MHQKSFFLVLVLISSFSLSWAQKLDLDKEVLKHNFVRLPSSSDLANLKTYSVTMFANKGNLDRLGFTSDKIETLIKLDGFIYTTQPADIKIEITIGDLKKRSEEVKTKETASYQNATNVATKSYVATTYYLIPTSIRIIKTLNNEVLNSKEFGNESTPVVLSSEEFSTMDAANASLRGSDEKRLEKLKDVYFDIFAEVINNFKERYDYTLTSETDAFSKVNLKKNPEFSEFNEKLAFVKDVFAQLKGFEDLSLAHEKLDPLMQSWKEEADKVPASEKKSKKKHLYLINLALTQYWLDMADECAATCQLIIDNDFKIDGKTYQKAANTLKAELKNSPNGTRHFMRDGFTSATRFRASEIQPLPVQLPSPPAGFKAFTGTMTNVLGEKYNGALWVKATGVMSFEPKDEARFVYEKDGAVSEQPIDNKQITEIKLNSGERFARFKHESSNLFFQVLHETNGHRVLKYIRSNEGPESTGAIIDFNNGKELSLMNVSTGKIQSIGGLLENSVAKRTAEFYGSCDSAKTKILAGEFGKMNDLAGQIKVIAFVEQNCQ